MCVDQCGEGGEVTRAKKARFEGRGERSVVNREFGFHNPRIDRPVGLRSGCQQRLGKLVLCEGEGVGESALSQARTPGELKKCWVLFASDFIAVEQRRPSSDPQDFIIAGKQRRVIFGRRSASQAMYSRW